ncbi:unnamed protein product [Bursaphelenchus okinawaensis]|uniref:Protein kinase domain-containing protein n=1 Tax=Bursaphelenchus okinawaensis TaxID=465554 RepID=A0A811K8C5_9BILA|nr:unnamed protein product [Bursaphelenchus okinawaensis]CAG9094233.1 unnamed protein product [Bursaphelenchus okinawaensis]
MAALEIIQLEPGTPVEKWEVVKKLGEGGFGAVYKVKDASDFYALKVEGVSEPIQVLKIEVNVLQELNDRNGRHNCKLEGKGKFANFNYVVMSLVGKSLQDLRKDNENGYMTTGCAVSVSMQCLEALEDLHNIGYLHRDIKPGNYAVGRAELNELRKVYILDFGMCRKYTDDNGVIKKPRKLAAFRGTVRYASIACHMQRELGRKDDVETWLYMAAELTHGNLPWKTIQDLNEVGDYKRRCTKMPFMLEVFQSCPKGYNEIATHIHSLKFYDPPDYEKYYTLMRKAYTEMGIKEFPYDWEK